jgi:hypothetical protein
MVMDCKCYNGKHLLIRAVRMRSGTAVAQTEATDVEHVVVSRQTSF